MDKALDKIRALASGNGLRPNRARQIPAGGKYLFFSLTALLSILTQPVATDAQADDPQSAVEGFIGGLYHSPGGETMQYRLFVPPGYDRTQKYPIVLWLHGAAGRGGDNVSELSGGNFAGSHIWTKPEIQQKYHAFVLAPQVDLTKGWARPHTNTPPVAIRLALETLDTVETRYSIDRTREYIAGQSMGGEGVWAALSVSPRRFAAAMALCGYGDAYMIPRVAKIPVWIFQGEEDPVVPVARAREWVKRLREAGATPKYTEYPGVGHNVWDLAFALPDLVAWLFSHHND
jgi:predicted peptidase